MITSAEYARVDFARQNMKMKLVHSKYLNKRLARIIVVVMVLSVGVMVYLAGKPLSDKRVPTRSSKWFHHSSSHSPKTIKKDVHFLILSYPENIEKRRLQRQHWLKNLPDSFEYKYVLGNPEYINWSSEKSRLAFIKEQKTNNDLLYVDELEEAYENIGAKVFWGLDWIRKLSLGNNNPKTFRYIVKTDDDILLRFDEFKKIIDSRPVPDTNLYWGHVYEYPQPARDKNDKWYVSYEQYPDKFYPPYACGPLYMLSWDLVGKVIEQANHYDFTLFPMEDVQMGMLMKKMGIKPTDNNGAFSCRESNNTNELFIHQ